MPSFLIGSKETYFSEESEISTPIDGMVRYVGGGNNVESNDMVFVLTLYGVLLSDSNNNSHLKQDDKCNEYNYNNRSSC